MAQPRQENVDLPVAGLRHLRRHALEGMRPAGPERQFGRVAGGRPARRHEQAVVEQPVAGAAGKERRRQAGKIGVDRRDVGIGNVLAVLQEAFDERLRIAPRQNQ